MLSHWIIPTAVIISWMAAHITKEIIHLANKNTFSWHVLLFETGGMPSSHTASAVALATTVFLVEGFGVFFWIALFFMAIVIRDAFGVRKSVGDHAKVLNVLLSHAKLEKKVRIVLGHTPFQVLMGAVTGLLTTGIVFYVFQQFF